MRIMISRATFVIAAFIVACAAFMALGQQKVAKPPIDRAQGRQAAGKSEAVKIPAVALSKGHAALCKVKVGNTMPDFSLPQLAGGGTAKLSSLYGDKATVVVFWSGDRRMSREQLADMGPEVVEPFGKSGVAVVGVAVGAAEADAQAVLDAAKADFLNLIDADGKAFAQVGSEKLPRTYLLDPQGKILWFDIEYSLGTRRELNQALRAVAGAPNPAG
jgi:peroxiredoxin